jgi:hypothetical protein
MKRLQPFDFKSSNYERPNQEWVCGRKDCGDACPLGPDLKGNCRATAECHPRKDGDRWFCTRTDARGGKCPDGPRPDGSCCRPVPPCVPRRSVRARRRITVLLVSALTLGGVFLALGHPKRDNFFNPGPLTAAHASGAANCALCHTAAQVSGEEWLKGAFTKSGAHSDSQLCLNCHNLGPRSGEPHSLAPAVLALLTKKITGAAAPRLAAAEEIVPTDSANQLACATCHQEHHGRDADLTKIADASCQVCHVKQFASFASGHPGFDKYPYTRRTRIEFDHAAHIGTYFPDAAKKPGQTPPPTQCNDCHTTAPDNRLMLTKGFAANCAACHLDNITKPGGKGLAVFGIPGLDKKSIDAKTTGIGQWPADADGELTPFMRQLLASDPKTSPALAALKGTDLTNLTNAKQETLDAAAQLAWAVKGLFADLITKGHDSLNSRLPVAALGQLPPESVKAFTQPGWWPDLLAEVADHSAGKPPAKAATLVAPPTPVAAASAPVAKPATTDDILGGDDILATAPKPAPAASAKPAAADDLLGGDDILAGPTPSAPGTAKPSAPPVPKVPTPVAPEKWAAAGGWHVSPADFTLRYKPAGHADAFLQAWLDLTATTATENDSAARAIFTEIAAASSCVKCHSVDNAPASPGKGATAVGTALLVNWRAAAPAPQLHTFTKFSHGTHFALLDQHGCQTCHQLAPAAAGVSYTVAFKDNHDPAKFSSSFQRLNQATCAQCHVERGAGTSCLLCHNYHVGDFAPAKVTSLFQAATPKP